MKMPYRILDQLVFRIPRLSLAAFKGPDDSSSFVNAIKEPVFLASPSLLKKFENLQKEGRLDDDKGLLMALFKYYSRMHARSTPYGLFAACGIGAFGKETRPFTNSFRRETRLDMSYSVTLAEKLSKLPLVRDQVRYFANTSIYTMKDRFRYQEYIYPDDVRKYQLSAIDYSTYLENIIRLAEQGETLENLAKSICDDEITFEDAFPFVLELVDAQMLISELEPAITQGNIMDGLIRVLGRYQEMSPEIQGVYDRLQEVEADIKKIDQTFDNPVNVYYEIADKLAAFDTKMDISTLFQTDLFLDNSITVEYKYRKYIEKGVELMLRLSPPQKKEKTSWSRFVKTFSERYETASVPLLLALDPELGIDYVKNRDYNPDNLIKNLGIANIEEQTSFTKVFQSVDSFLISKIEGALANGLQEVELTDEELHQFPANWDNLPPSFSVIFKILEDDLIYLSMAGGTSAVNVLGRFGLGSEEIKEHCLNIAKMEEEQLPANTILAEVVHLPESRSGNILLHPVFREYEIPYVANIGVPQDKKIHLKDLYLRYSGREDNVILYSKKLNARIIPRLSHSHNFHLSSALPLYSFLGDMQLAGGRRGASFRWGSASDLFQFYPRLRYKKTLLSLATWELDDKEYGFAKEKKAPTSLLEPLEAWRTKWKMPDRILVVDGDNELLIDFRIQISALTLLDFLKKRKHITISEFPYDEDRCPIRNQDQQAYTNEFVAAMVKTTPSYNRVDDLLVPDAAIKRNFPPGSEWSYYKLYCGYSIADDLLISVIYPLMADFLEKKWIDKWFFLRFEDPDLHLRIRLHMPDPSISSMLYDQFYQAVQLYVEGRTIWKIQIDTYLREVERYGAPTIGFCEEWFYLDSQSVPEIIALNKNNPVSQLWKYAVVTVDNILDSFGLSIKERIELIKPQKKYFDKEYGINQKARKKIRKQFEDDYEELENLLQQRTDREDSKVLRDIINRQNVQTQACIAGIVEYGKQEDYRPSLHFTISNFIHMHINRLFPLDQRAYETVIYNFLFMLYHRRRP